MPSKSGTLQTLRRSTFVAFLLAVIATFTAKRRYKKATVVMLAKRLIGWVVARVMPIPTPEVVSGKGSIQELARVLKNLQCKKPLIVTDKMLVDHGLVQPAIDALCAEGLNPEVYDAVVPNPPSELVEEGHELYQKKQCDSIIAFGGGSPMDVAKVIGAKVANPSPTIEAYQGYFMCTRFGLRPLPPLIAVPTTAGTGSETTVAAVITIKKDNKKIAIADMGLVPRVAILDPQLLVKLPKGVTSATGMDALTHAMESYMSGWSSDFSRTKSLNAAAKVFNHLTASYQDGTNLASREAMLNASFDAGLAFTRANVGNVHAIAHQFGGMFHTAHGVANAMLLPYVLNFYLEDEDEGSDNLYCTMQFCEIAHAAGLALGYDANSTSASEKRAIARKLVSRIEEMNKDMNIDREIKEMKASDVEEVANRALREAHGQLHPLLQRPLAWALDLGYPNPKYMTHDDCKKIVAMVLPEAEKRKWHQNC